MNFKAGAALGGMVIAIWPLTAVAAPDAAPVIRTSDVERFYAVYDAAGGHPTAEQLQSGYLDSGSDGLHTFARVRNISGASIAATLARQPGIYTDARRCAAVLPAVRRRLQVALRNLADLYPEARFPPVTVAVGRGKPVAVGGPADGVMVGLEALCGIRYFDADLEDRFVHVISHEYIHVQQSASLTGDDKPTVLKAALMEGGAEFLGEMISGGIGNPGAAAAGQGRELEIETAFAAAEDDTDLSKWVYNGTLDKPGDLGYWVGYRIVKSYYRQARDKRQAIRDILDISDPKSFLAKSGWRPGIDLK